MTGVQTCALPISPSRDSVPSNFSTLPNEQRMRILTGDTNGTVSKMRFHLVMSAMSKASGDAITQPATPLDTFSGHTPSYTEPADDTAGRRISWMDLDLDSAAAMDMQDPIVPPPLDTHISPHPEQQSSAFVDPGKSSNPLIWGYPNYFDAAPTFEQSQYYSRPTIGQIISKPIKRVKNGLHSKRTQQIQMTAHRNHPIPTSSSAIPHHQLARVSYQNPDGSMDPMQMFTPQT